jgi:hypothetical protein
MTLLVRRVPEENAKCPYAVQISLPKELTLGELCSLTSVLLINNMGVKASVLETTDSYHPHEWRAASPSEQAQYTSKFNGNPFPWHCVMRSLSKSVYDYPGGGDKDTNNGQLWTEFGNLNPEWSSERKLSNKCQEELDAEWAKRIAQESKKVSPADCQVKTLRRYKYSGHPSVASNGKSY